MSDAGHIEISVAAGHVHIVSTRNRAITKLFVGRTPAFVTETIPLIFSVCSAAQALASRQCLHAAEGLAPVTDREASMAVAAEALREHFMRIAVDWQNTLSLAPASSEDLRRIFRLPRLAAERDGTLSLEARELLSQWVGPSDAILAGPDVLADLPSTAARLIRLVKERKWDGLGATGFPDESERTALRLVADDPGLADLIGRHGESLLARLYSRLVHAARLVLDIESGEKPQVHIRQADRGRVEAHVTTSRGMLTHCASMHRGVVAEYEITAPTDVNFAAGGPTQKALLKLAEDTQDDLEVAARMMVEAFDPCVGYSLRVQ